MYSSSRREFLRTCLGGAAAGLSSLIPSEGALAADGTGGGSAIAQQALREGRDLPKPTPAQLVWQECEIGVIYHFDLPIAAREFAPNNTARETRDPNLYNPTQLDTDQWLEAAAACGAKYAVFTATHFNGFMQWQSDLYPYGLKQTRWRDGKGDVVADFVESCRKRNIRPGIYLSCHRNVYWELWRYYVDWGRGRGTPEQEEYNRVAEGMTEELCSRYGPLVELWYDAGVKTPAEGGPDVLPLFEKHQPDAVFYHSKERADHRWIGNESGRAGDPCWATMPLVEGELSHNSASWKACLLNGDPAGRAWSPGMVDVPLRGAAGVHSWVWRPGQDHAAYATDRLVRVYYESVGRNCNFIVGEVVTPEGLVPQSDIDRLREFGGEIERRFGEAVADTDGVGDEIRLELRRPGRIDHCVIMEDIAQGERIRAYKVEGLLPGNRWQELCRGASVGNKRIHHFESVEVAVVKLTVEQAVATPMLRRLAVFNAS